MVKQDATHHIDRLNWRQPLLPLHEGLSQVDVDV